MGVALADGVILHSGSLPEMSFLWIIKLES